MSDGAAGEGGNRGAEALKAFREATVDICDVIPLTAEGDFEISSDLSAIAIAAGSALLVDTVATGLRYDRTPGHVARGGLDHYQVTLCIDGEMEFSSGRRALTLRPGDIGLIDMAQPNHTTLIEGAGRRSRLRAAILPRAVLARRLAHPDSATATLLSRGDEPPSRLAAGYAGLWQRSPGEDAAARVEAVADLVARAVGSAAQTDAAVERSDRQLFLAMIKRYVDAHLDTETLAADDLCRRFGLSRASLYRMFVPDGGLASYVQEQRLNLAMRRLISPQARDIRLIDLAVDLQFSSDSTFVRAFRRKFGLTPGELRERSEAWWRAGGPPLPPNDILHTLAKR